MGGINPPWRLDPFQMVVNVNWGGVSPVIGSFMAFDGHTLHQVIIGDDGLPAFGKAWTPSTRPGVPGSLEQELIFQSAFVASGSIVGEPPAWGPFIDFWGYLTVGQAPYTPAGQFEVANNWYPFVGNPPAVPLPKLPDVFYDSSLNQIDALPDRPVDKGTSIYTGSDGSTIYASARWLAKYDSSGAQVWVVDHVDLGDPWGSPDLFIQHTDLDHSTDPPVVKIWSFVGVGGILGLGGSGPFPSIYGIDNDGAHVSTVSPDPGGAVFAADIDDDGNLYFMGSGAKYTSAFIWLDAPIVLSKYAPDGTLLWQRDVSSLTGADLYSTGDIGFAGSGQGADGARVAPFTYLLCYKKFLLTWRQRFSGSDVFGAATQMDWDLQVLDQADGSLKKTIHFGASVMWQADGDTGGDDPIDIITPWSRYCTPMDMARQNDFPDYGFGTPPP